MKPIKPEPVKMPVVYVPTLSLRQSAQAAWIDKQTADAEKTFMQANKRFEQRRGWLLTGVNEVLQRTVAPESVERHEKHVAVTSIEGLQFYVDCDSHGMRQIYLLGQCSACGTEQSALISSPAELGKQIEEFKPRYHKCLIEKEQSPTQPTTEEALLIALENFIYARR